MKTKRLALSLAVAMLLPIAGASVAAPDTVAAPAAQLENGGGYLGIGLVPVSDEVRAQLGDVLQGGQGVMIRDVAADSPAAASGLQPYDILLSYDDQKLYSADQLSRLVRADAPNRKAVLTVVRGGTLQEVDVTLGQRQVADFAAPGIPGPRSPWMSMPRNHFQPYGFRSDDAARGWERFDELSLKKLDDGTYQARIGYLDSNGELVSKTFTGTREAIRQQLTHADDLPSVERSQLLEALSARGDVPFMRGPMFGLHPFGPRAFEGWPDY
ncbi:MAG: PDZ domain-containing protein [Gammaproteobacteria bacterium]|nr:PDZ domain-containing protein [Gammaproteobacteria bacterium]